MGIFIIGSHDYSSNILTGTYNVNKNSEYKEIQDANGFYHRFPIRDRVSGSFDMRFLKMTDYEQFVMDLKDLKASNGSYPVTVAINNTLTTEPINAYIDCNMVRNITQSGLTYFETFTVTLEER